MNTAVRQHMDNKRKKLDDFIDFVLQMDNVQAERNELRMLVDTGYWRWSNRNLLKKIRKVGKTVLKKGTAAVPAYESAEAASIAETTEPEEFVTESDIWQETEQAEKYDAPPWESDGI